MKKIAPVEKKRGEKRENTKEDIKNKNKEDLIKKDWFYKNQSKNWFLYRPFIKVKKLNS